MRELWRLDPAAYDSHPVHRAELVWPESNCYVDLWVELLHTYGVEPMAAMPFTLAVDLEGDQWTFFKFPLADLYALYGIEVFELNIWDRLLRHVEEQLSLGRPCLVEVDAFHLPDTAGTSYHAEHVKTSIGIQALDADAGRLGYFHNAGYYELDGLDFGGVFRFHEHLGAAEFLAPYVEVAKLRMRSPLSGRALVNASLDLLAANLARLPRANPFRRYAMRFSDDLEQLSGNPLEWFHRYAFATFRQAGAAFELGGAYLRWLQANGEHQLEPIATACDVIATTAKALQFKTARFVSTRRPFDASMMLDTMAVAWDEAAVALAARYGAVAHPG
ncbi:MAG: DUF1839 family protein [Vicinamibacterales bacterium]